MEKPESLLVELLDMICMVHKTDAIGIQVTCTAHHIPNSVSLRGFILLEDCEGALGSAEQQVRRILWEHAVDNNNNNNNLDNFLTDPLLFALTARVSRHVGTVIQRPFTFILFRYLEDLFWWPCWT